MDRAPSLLVEAPADGRRQMVRRASITLSLVAAFLVVGTAASAGQVTFHPSGFGPQSYAAWKAHQGLADSRGNDSQAFYMQKMVPTTTFAAGVAVFKGFEGLPAEDLDGLEWKHRTDGHCGAGAPRWNVNVVDENTGERHTAFLGCFAAAHSAVVESDPDHDWCRDTYTDGPIEAAIAAATLDPTDPTDTATPLVDLEVRNLVIVFDEGPEVNNPEPPGCPVSTTLDRGFVHLDDITVIAEGQTRIWTSANDNGNGGASTANSTLTASELEAVLDAPLSSLLQ
jgi:hypothetical protein